MLKPSALISRYFTTPGLPPLDMVKWEQRNVSGIPEPVEVPLLWSHQATDTLVPLFFRAGSETSIKHIVTRIAQAIREAGEDFGNYFDTQEEAEAFEAELTYILLTQHGTFDAPVWSAYSDTQKLTPGWFWDFATHEVKPTDLSGAHPPYSSCVIEGAVEIPEDMGKALESGKTLSISDDFMEAVLNGGEWKTLETTSKAQTLWDKASGSSDVEMVYDSILNEWNTVPNTGRVHLSTPEAGYAFLNDSACMLGAINLVTFLDEEDYFNLEAYHQTIRVLCVAQEILIDFSSFPTKAVAQQSHDYRPLGLSYTNMGGLLTRKGIDHTSPDALAITGALAAILTGKSYAVSAEIAAKKGAFNGYAINKEPMLRVMSKHRAAIDEIDSMLCPELLLEAAHEDWDEALRLGEEYGYRNAQTTLYTSKELFSSLLDYETIPLEPMTNLRLAAAAQPFFSGTISHSLQAADSKEAGELAFEAWKMGLKTVVVHYEQAAQKETQAVPFDPHALQPRRKLASERQALTHSFSIGGHKGYITVGLYEDGQPGEIFLTMGKQGSTIAGLLNSFAMAVSLTLQYGAPLEVLVSQFSELQFEPSGITSNDEIRIAQSVVDYIFRWMELKFLSEN